MVKLVLLSWKAPRLDDCDASPSCVISPRLPSAWRAETFLTALTGDLITGVFAGCVGEEERLRSVKELTFVLRV